MRTLAWILGIILALSLVSNIALIAERERDNTPKVEYVHKTDTIIHWKYNTDTIYIKGKDKIKYETKVINDTVWIKDEPVTTTDSTSNYIIDINAVKLNWYRLRMMKNDTITINTTTVKTINSPSKGGFYYGLGVGAGYGVFTRKPDIFVGFTLGYRFK